MKKILYLLCSCFAVTLMASCEDFLDKTPQGDKTDQDIFSRFNETESLINRLYFYARAADQPLVHIRFFSDSALTDECEGSSAENGWSNKFNDGDWEPGSQLYTSCNATTNAGACHTFWPKLYEDIRCANVILEGIEKYNTPDSEARPGTLSQRIGEVLFIRAYLHYCVLKSYGECPYVDYTVNPNALPPFERENIHTIVEKICRDCDEAYARVPAQNLMDQFGRVEKGACLALKAMALWIAATPLYNGSTLKGDTRNYASVYQSYDPARWDAAAAAVMDFEAEGQKRYSLYQGSPKSQTTDSGGTDQSNGAVYSRLWELFHRTMNDAKKAEWIFFHLHCKTVGYHNDMYPPSAQGQAREVPVQDQVDEYEVIGPDGYGYPIYALKQNHKALYGSLISEEDMAKAYDDGNPYVNRDPRFYRDAVCRHFGVSKEDILKALAQAKVKGRIEMIKVSDDFTLMIDYAHNAMSLESLLTTLKEYHPKRLVCLFGCGGNRARSRRFEMGEVSGRLADLTIITSDNPRFEKPLDIIADIRTGIEKTDGKYIEIPDRKEAIAWAIHHGQKGDVIVLAGKGHASIAFRTN